MYQQIFVRRERELAQLQTFLDRALAGQGQMVFIVGEAGSGKTALVTEFSRRAQNAHPELVMAIGDCNAQTGIGDPYLPFREVLGLLTGDVEPKLAEGAITEENASRLRELVRVSGQALVDLGPELIGVFVPGVGLAAKAGAFAAEKVGWLDRLERITDREGKAGVDADLSTGRRGDRVELSGQGLDQGRIFEQYTNVLKALAQQRPLILVLDDLQWADKASLSLLFHLARRISDSRILLIGTYRPAEVALGRPSMNPSTGPLSVEEASGRGGVERHPLEPVVNELKRYYGDIEIRLEPAAQEQDPQELERFVEDYIDRVLQPNRLGQDFKHLVLERTEAHPLFLVELLRDMVERGWLAQDEEGVWYQAQELAFHDLPARVEAVIEERISRLEEELREILTVASVEGEDFTAQVVASVQRLNERQLLPRLSRQLDKQHQLIGERGVERLNGTRLFLYRFRHSLFQRHLYNGLTEAERVMLHEDVGVCLEQLYAGKLEEVAVQLARHFLESYQYEKAFRYLVMAGEAAQGAYANDEAIAFYMRALTLDDEAQTQPTDWAHVHERLGDVYSLMGEYQPAMEHYEQALDRVEDSRGRAALHRKLGRTFEKWGRYDRAIASFEAGLMEMRERLDAAEAAGIYNGLSLVYYRLGKLDEAVELGTLALQMAERLGHEIGVAHACNNLGIIHQSRGDLELAIEYHRRSLAIWEATQNSYGLAASHNNLGLLYQQQEEWEPAIHHYQQSLELAEKIGNRHGMARTYDNLGQVYIAQGQPENAMECLEKAVTILAEIGIDESKIYPEMWQSGAW